MKLLRTPKPGDVIDATDSMYPSDLKVVEGVINLPNVPNQTFGFVLQGVVAISYKGHLFELQQEAYFAIPGEAKLTVQGSAVLVTRYGYRGQFGVGMIETRGRLSYIDGCSDSMLYYPPRMGDPVFNHLHFPRGIVQSQHTHPSIRLGIVCRGNGHAFGPHVLGEAEMWVEPLTKGCVFQLEEQEMHSFRTDHSKESMDVIAYHPDSDWGPSDQAHPMLNRTYIGANVFARGNTAGDPLANATKSPMPIDLDSDRPSSKAAE